MKKVLFALFALILLVACSSPNTLLDATDAAENAPNITTLEKGVWPVNPYTDGLPIPAGIVNWAMLDTEHKNCSISLVDISETDYNSYMELLKQEGFSVLLEDVSEKIKGQDYISVGILLSDGEKALSIHYIPNSFTIYISNI